LRAGREKILNRFLGDLVPIKSDISSKMSGSSTKGEVR
jgi:hypothetical protein